MESWFLYALASAVFAGLYSFTTRVSAHYQHHSALVYVYSSLSAAILSGVYAMSVQPDTSRIVLIVFIACIDALAYLVVSMTRVDALKVIDSAIFFPIYKVAASILTIPVGILFFSDVLTGTQVIGIFIGLLAPVFLINNGERLRQKNLSKGLLLTGVSVLAALLATVMSKMITVLHLDVSLYTFFAFAIGTPFAYLFYKRTNGQAHRKRHVEWLGLLGGIFMFGNLFFYVHALSGNLSMVFLINSFSTVIVVFLSVLIFREHMDKKKVGALVATIISLILLK
ncbi:EamA family transporter [Candidatus Uhrbacteria bacterium]|nr:EamA family transporter [Candidatus Uhrbacteria bacterium]